VPFTPAHPAAVLPLLRRGHWVSAALVTGSMAPDLPTYLPLGLTHDQTHPLTAILWPDGLLALGLLVLWWGPLRPGLMSLWPGAAARSGPPGWRDPAIRRSSRALAGWVGWLLLSELVGLATHLVWDAFTHEDGYVARRWSPLRHPIGGHPVYNLLQLWCSVLGMAIVGVYLLVQWRRRTTRAAAPVAVLPRRVRLAVVAVLALALVVTGLVTGHDLPHPYALHRPWLWRQRLVNSGTVLLTLVAVWSVVLVVVRGVVKQRRLQAEPSPPRPHTTAPLDVP
jgi:hypothetical protein